MSDPTTALNIMAVGTGMQASSQLAEGRAAAASGSAQAAWSEYNAQVADSRAEAERMSARYDARRHRSEAERFKALQRVAGAASGVETDSPTSLLVRAETAEQLELDALMTERTGRMRASHLESQAQYERMRGRHAKSMGQWSKRMSRWQAGTSLLTGFGDIYQQAHQAGLTGKG